MLNLIRCTALTIMFSSFGMCASDPFVGTWVLRPELSKYAAGAMPKSMIIQMDTVGLGIRYRSQTVRADGQSSYAIYTAEYNGPEAVVSGATRLAPVVLKRIDPYTVEAIYKKDGKLIAVARRVAARDGQSMTVSTTVNGKDGKVSKNTGIYERQLEAVSGQ